MFVADSRRLVRLPRFPSHCSCPLSASLLVSQRKPKESNTLFLRNVVFTSNNTAVLHHPAQATFTCITPRVRMIMNTSRIFPPSRRGRSKIRNLTFLHASTMKLSKCLYVYLNLRPVRYSARIESVDKPVFNS